MTKPTLALIVLALAAGCRVEHEFPEEPRLQAVQAELGAAARRARYEQIRGAAAERGLVRTGYLLAGIAYAETGLAHCWSEAQWACQGPDSRDCGDGPVIAGAADGPCNARQGGLGMFQFDAGTFDDTLARYGRDVLTVAGNTDHAINYVINMTFRSQYTRNAENEERALQWLIDFDIHNADLRDDWIRTVTHYYNGCRPDYGCWNQRYAHYNDSLQTVIDETGLDFWVVNPEPPDQPPRGALDAVACDGLSGWAQDPDAAAEAIDVHVYFGGPAGSGATSLSVRADARRDDVCEPLGSCEHGFALPSPLSLFDGQPHPVHAYGIGAGGEANAELGDSPRPLQCQLEVPAGVRRHVIHPESYAAWRLDAFWDRLPAPAEAVDGIERGPDAPAAPVLVRADDGSPEVWVLDGEQRRHVPSADVMRAWRFSFDAVEQRPAAEVQALAEGPPWRARPVEVLGADGAVYLLDDPPPAPPVAPDAALPEPASDAGTPGPGPAPEPDPGAGGAPFHPEADAGLGFTPDAFEEEDPGDPRGFSGPSPVRGASLKGGACQSAPGLPFGAGWTLVLGLPLVVRRRRR